MRRTVEIFPGPAAPGRAVTRVALTSVAFFSLLGGANPAGAHESQALASWSFNDGSGATLADSSGSRDGDISGATWVIGKYGQALSFAGDAAVTLGDLDLTGSFTVMAWMQTRTLSASGCRSLVMKALDYGFEVCNGRLHAGVGDGSDWTAYPSIPLTASDLNVWKHVALAYDGAALFFYVDGTLVASASGAHASNGSPLLFGQWTSGENWDGLIDEVRIYEAALAAADIQEDMVTPVPNPPGQLFHNDIVISGLNLPTNIEFLPDGSMLVGELGGTIQILPPGATQISPVPFLTLTNVGSTNGQQGLMDIELDPEFATNGHYYVFYTRGSPNRDRASRFTAVGATTDPGTEFVVYQDDVDANAEHHGGALSFGPDDKVYITTGEHFDAAASQDLSSPHGKILRVNKDGTIPTDNPFFDGGGPNRDEVWALGLRNPYRASFDAVTGRYFIGDVGGNDFSTAFEEVNIGVAGANYGWPICEGPCAIGGITSPLFSYPHDGRDASVTGGFVYRGTQFPVEYHGSYFYADYTQNWIRRLTFDANGDVAASLFFEPEDGSADGPFGDIVHMTQGPDGALYYVDLGYSDTTGTFGVSKIRRISYLPPGNQPPVVVAGASPTSGAPPLTVAFTSSGTLDPESQPLTYLWDFGDGTTATVADASHTYTADGLYTATLTASDGELTTTSSPIPITVGNPPQASISFPSTGATFRAGDEVFFGGTAVDTEDGTLPASAYTWTINFLHAGHVHPALPLVGATQGSFVVPTTGHDYAGNTRYEIRLTVTDSDGLQATTAVLVFPEKVDLTFDTVPSGLTVKLDGIVRLTPFVHDSLIGFVHSVEALDQTQSGTSYTFSHWSDGGPAAHTIAVPATAQSYIASFSGAPPPQPLAFARSGGAFSDATGATLNVPLTGVQAGSLIVAYVKWEGSAAGTLTLSDGTSTFTADALNSAANGDLHGRFYYLLSSSRSGTVTYTATWSAGRPYRKLMIYEYSYGGGAVTLDSSNRATGTSGSLSSGNITTTGTDEVVFGAYGEYDSANTTAERINGVLADQVQRASFASMWSKAFTAPFTGAATATGNSSTWIGNVIAFKQGAATPNTAPTISNITDGSTAEDTGTGATAFTVGDAETAPGSLTLSGTSSNPSVVTNGGITFGGSGASRTVAVTPVADASGLATITVTVSDGSLTGSDAFQLTVTAVNDLPTISSVPDQSTPGGVAVGPLPLTVGDVETAAGSLTLSASSSDPALIPVGNVVFGGAGASRTVTVTPASGSTGTALITLTVNDGTNTAATSFNVTVTAANTAPTIGDITDRSTAEDTGTGAIAFTVGDTETAPGSLTLSGTSSNPSVVTNGGIAFGGSGANRTVSVTPVANANGLATITVTVSDGSLTGSDTFQLTVTAVNDLPTISTVADQTTSVGVAVGPLAVTVGDVETAVGSLTLSGSSSNTALVPNGNIAFGGSGANRTVTVTPAAGLSGSATITVTVSDETDTVPSSFALTVNSTPSTPLTFARSAGAFNNASGTTLGVQLTNVQAGSLIVVYVKWEGAAGAVTLSDGASAFTADTLNSAVNGDLHGRFYYVVSSSASGTVTYTATWSAARPYRRIIAYEYSHGGGVSFDVSNRATGTSATLSSGNITTTGSDEVAFGAYGEYSSVTTTAEGIGGVLADRVQRADDASMWSKGFTAPFTGAATASGVSSPWIGNVIAFKQGGAQPNTAPTISDITDRGTVEDTGTGAIAFTVGDAETAPGSLTLSGTSSNPSVVTNGGIAFGGSGASRTVSVTPVANASGTATITVTVSDGSLTGSDAFQLTVTAVNDLPTISSVPDQSTPGGVAVGPLPLTVGDVETAAGSLTLSASSSDPALIPVGNVVFGGAGASRTVTVTPASGSTGTALITLTVNDGTNTAATSFNVTVTAANTAPTIGDITDRSTAEDTGTGAIAFTVGDTETAPGSLTLSGTSSNPSVVTNGGIAFGGSGANRTVSVTPVANANGLATITVTVSDGSLTGSDTFQLTVTAVNDLPTISTVADQTTSVGVAVGPLAVTVGDVETAVGSLTLSGSSSNTALVPNGNIAFGGSGANRTVTVTPAAGLSGSATITVTVSDETDTVPSSFALTVNSTPSVPLTFARSGGAFNDASGTTLSVSLTGVQTGSLIVAYVKWEGSATGTLTLSDGTSTFTADAINSAGNGDLHGRFYYLPSSSRSGTVTYTATWSAGKPYRKLMIYEYSYGGGTVTLDASNRATGTSGTLTTGNITTTGTDEVVFGAYGEYNSDNTTAERVAGVLADQVLRASFASMWSKTFTAPFTGPATATGNSSTWIGNVIAFKRAAGP